MVVLILIPTDNIWELKKKKASLPISRGKRWSFQMVMDQLDTHMKEKEKKLDPYLTPYTEIGDGF